MKQKYEVRVIPSVFDRLIDLEPGIGRDLIPSRAESVRNLKSSLRRDLEYLLNTRNPFDDLSPAFVEVQRSALSFGLPDFSYLNLSHQNDQLRLQQIIEAAIRVFEPRLTSVRVSLIRKGKGDTHQGALTNSEILNGLRLRVDARLRLEPVPEPVSFDMVLEIDHFDCQVRETSG